MTSMYWEITFVEKHEKMVVGPGKIFEKLDREPGGLVSTTSSGRQYFWPWHRIHELVSVQA